MAPIITGGVAMIQHDLTIQPELIQPGNVERFLQRVQVGSDEECWEWQGPRGLLGHGQFKFQNRTVPAHVFAWVLQFGAWPAPVVRPPRSWKQPFIGCHHCDNPPCCNPWHIYPGTHQDNLDDVERRGRIEYWQQQRVAAGFPARMDEVLYDEVFFPQERASEIPSQNGGFLWADGGFKVLVVNEERAKAYYDWLKRRQQRER
jgi:hypothetical protein